MKTYLVRVKERFAIPDEDFPEYNSGYNYGPAKECIMTEGHEPDQEVYDYEILGELPAESKIC